MFALSDIKQTHKIEYQCSCCGCPALQKCLRMQGVTKLYSNPNKEVFFSSHLYLNKIKDQSLHTTWSYSLDNNRLKLKVMPNSSDLENLSGLLCAEFKRHFKKINTYIMSLMSRLPSQISELIYCLSHDGAIVVQSIMTKYVLIQSQINLQKYFTRQINLLKNQIIDLVQNVSFYFEIFPFRIIDDDIAEPLNIKSHQALKKEMIDLFRLGHYYELLSKNQQNPSADKNRLRIEQFKHRNCIDILFGQKQLQKYIASFKQNHFNPKPVYEMELKKLQQSFTKKNRPQSQFVTSIKILKSQKIEYITQGSFGCIKKGRFSYITQISMYGKGSSPQETQKNSQSNAQPSALSQYLVIKEGIIAESKGTNASFDIEIKFLKYMRNKKCRSFAKYFCNIGMEPFSDGLIYLQYYPENFQDSVMDQPRKLKVIEDVCIGLSFLNEEKIIHRDLKPANIMIDRYRRGRLIDFGSIGSLSNHKDLKGDGNVRSTPGYYIPYTQAKPICNQISKMTPTQYYFHDNYDLYSLGVMLQNLFNLNQCTGINNFFRNSLELLSNKCKLVNPNDRWSVHQVTIYMIRLFNFYLHREHFWKFGMNDGLSAYDFQSGNN